MKPYLLKILFVLMGTIVFAQQKTHTVQPKETIYGISKQYNVSQDQLKNANPFLKSRELQIGDVLVIPGGSSDGKITTQVTTTQPAQEDVYIPKEDENFIYLEIKPKQTLYSITKEYNISEDALKSINPQLNQGLKAGDIIRIPKQKSSNNASNNTPTNNEIAVPEGMYRVKRGDTIYTLAKEFGCTEDEIYIANPSVQRDGLKVDSFIFIPQKGQITGKIQNDFIEHKVKPGETIYSITKLYKVTFADLLSNNPELSEGLKVGMTLKIPLQKGANIVKSTEKIKRIDDNEINIALMLPFHNNNKGSKAGERSISMDILTGAKIALDSLAKQGKRINLKVFDTENQASTIETLIAENNFSKFDAIVGPLFLSNFKSFATRLEGSGIPIVSPFSNSDELIGLENVLISTPRDESIADRIIDEIAQNYKGEEIIILTDSKHEELANYTATNLKKKISKAEIIVTKDVNRIRQNSQAVDEKLSDGTVVKKEVISPIMAVLVSDNNDLGKSFVEKLKTLDSENLLGFGIKYVAAYDIYSDSNKKNISALKNIGFTFGTHRLVNIYGTNERVVLDKFMDMYCNTPSEYQQIGFDVVYDLVDRMNSKGDVLNALGSEKTRLSSKFEYKKNGKSYVNESVRVLRLFVKEEESPEDTED